MPKNSKKAFNNKKQSERNNPKKASAVSSAFNNEIDNNNENIKERNKEYKPRRERGEDSYDARFDFMHKDPKYLPVSTKTTVTDSRLYDILDPSFTMIQKSRDSKTNLKEKALKNRILELYDFTKNPQALRVQKLKEAKKEMELQKQQMGEDDDDEEYNSDDSIEETREQLLGKTKKSVKENIKADEFFSDDDKENEEETPLDYDAFLQSLEGRPELENIDYKEEDDDIYNFDDEDDQHLKLLKTIGKATTINNNEEEEVNEQEIENLKEKDLWEKYLKENSNLKMINDGDETNRFAVLNCDWELIDSNDLFVLFQSLCPSFGKVISVVVYLSDFGKRELEREKVEGPGDLCYSPDTYEKIKETKRKVEQLREENRKQRILSRNAGKEVDSNMEVDYNNNYAPEVMNTNNKRLTMYQEIETEENEEMLDPIKVREYEMKRMKYYFAVVTCDSKQTASYLYNECDGYEFESTACVLDLRFISETTSFEGRTQKNSCYQMPTNYEPKQNIYSKALQSSKVSLSWDNNEPEREVLRRKDFNDVDEETLLQFIADSEEDEDSSSSSSAGEEEEEMKNKAEKKKKKKTTEEGEEEEEGEKKSKKKEKKLKEKEKKKNYKELLEFAKKKEKQKQLESNNEDEANNIEFVFNDDLKEKVQKEVVKKHLDKERDENLSWWEKAEQKRKEKKKQKRLERLEKIKEADEKISDDEDDDDLLKEKIDEDDLLSEEKLLKVEKLKKKKKDEKERKRREQIEFVMSGYEAKKGFDVKKDTAREFTRRVNKKDTTINQYEDDEEDNNKKTNNNILSDSRFDDLTKDPDFALDQTSTKFKLTKVTKDLMEKRRLESLKRQEKEESMYANENKKKLKKRKI
ncbi:hypothetical protein ABK040_011282 [Willaertia magna]